MSSEVVFFGGFLLFIILMLSIDLGLFNKKDHIVSFKEAAIMSFIWVSFAIGFYFLLMTEGQKLHGIGTYDQQYYKQGSDVTFTVLPDKKFVSDKFRMD